MKMMSHRSITSFNSEIRSEYRPNQVKASSWSIDLVMSRSSCLAEEKQSSLTALELKHSCWGGSAASGWTTGGAAAFLLAATTDDAPTTNDGGNAELPPAGHTDAGKHNQV